MFPVQTKAFKNLLSNLQMFIWMGVRALAIPCRQCSARDWAWLDCPKLLRTTPFRMPTNPSCVFTYPTTGLCWRTIHSPMWCWRKCRTLSIRFALWSPQWTPTLSLQWPELEPLEGDSGKDVRWSTALEATVRIRKCPSLLWQCTWWSLVHYIRVICRSLGDNNIGEIKPGSFSGLPRLEWFFLQDNKLTKFPLEDLANSSDSLVWLNFTNNYLRLDEDGGQSFPQLNRLWDL